MPTLSEPKIFRNRELKPGWHINDPDGGYISTIIQVETHASYIRLTVQENQDEPFSYDVDPHGSVTARSLIFSIEEIREKLATDWAWQRKGLLRLFDRQTDDEQSQETTRYHNKMGFSSAHAKKLSSFARQLRNGKERLSERQMYYVQKWLPCYAKQLHAVAYKGN